MYQYFSLFIFLYVFLSHIVSHSISLFLYPLSMYFIRYLSINVFHYLPFYMSLFISLYLSFILSLTPTLSLSSNRHGSLTYFTTTKINVQTGISFLKCRISTLSSLVRYLIQTINLTYGTDQLSGGRTGSSMHTTLLQQQLSGALYVLPKHALSLSLRLDVIEIYSLFHRTNDLYEPFLPCWPELFLRSLLFTISNFNVRSNRKEKNRRDLKQSNCVLSVENRQVSLNGTTKAC